MKHLIYDLEKSLKYEQKYMPNAAVVAVDSSNQSTATTTNDAFLARDGAARKMRFLKTWFDMPSEVFIVSLNLLDRFLTKLKVKSVYLDCASISCLYIACDLHKCPVSASDLVAISQVKCTISDLERMSDIIRNKLNLIAGDKQLTTVSFLEHYIKILESVTKQQNIKATILQRKSLLTRLEVVMLDSRCVQIRPSIVALALIQSEMGRMLTQSDSASANSTITTTTSSSSSTHSHEVIKKLWLDTCQLQNISMITPYNMLQCHSTLKTILHNYDNNARNIQRKRMKMRYSLRCNAFKPSENFCTHLCVIRE